jgi:hypothetical protein
MVCRRIAAVGAALALAGSLAGCSSGSDDRDVAPTAQPTPIERLDTAAIRLARVKFCDLMPTSSVRRALGGDPTDDLTWGNGDPAPVDDTPADVAHEFGCSWTGPSGAVARAWVFARPVSADFATTLVRQSIHRKGCHTESTTTFGTPALLQTCTLPGGIERVRRAGLFVDTWATCEITAPATDRPQARTDRWCVAVVSALDAGR